MNFPNIGSYPFRGEPIYISYTVQKGDRLSVLLQKTGMTAGEWYWANGHQNPDRQLRSGETIVLKDPIATCTTTMEDGAILSPELFEAAMRQFLFLEKAFKCEQQYSAFKPLQAFTKPLRGR